MTELGFTLFEGKPKPDEAINLHIANATAYAERLNTKAKERIDRAFELLKAETEERLFLPPVGVGKSVWCISKAKKIVSLYTVTGYLHDGVRWKVRLKRTIPSWIGNKAEHKYVAVKSFGKTTFLTKEEAEQALKGEIK